MASYQNTLLSRLQNLTNTQKSIQSLSFWVMYHHNVGDQFVNTWRDYLLTCGKDRFLPLIYLANDVLQNSKKKTQIFVDSFRSVFEETIPLVLSKLDEKNRTRVLRVLEIWGERGIYSTPYLDNLRNPKEEEENKPSTENISQNLVAPPPPSTIAHPIIKCFEELRKLRELGKSEKIGGEYHQDQINQLSSFMSMENIDLNQLQLPDLKSLKSEYEKYSGMLYKTQDFYKKKKDETEKLLGVLEGEMSSQKRLQETNYERERFWAEKKEKVDNFLKSIDVLMSSKEVDMTFDDSILGKRNSDSVRDNEVTEVLSRKRKKRKVVSRVNTEKDKQEFELPDAGVADDNFLDGILKSLEN